MPIISQTTAGPDDPIYKEGASFFVAYKNPNRVNAQKQKNQEEPAEQRDNSEDAKTNIQDNQEGKK